MQLLFLKHKENQAMKNIIYCSMAYLIALSSMAEAQGAGYALQFDGVDDYVMTANVATQPDTYTIMLFFKTASTNGGVLIGANENQDGSGGKGDRRIYINSSGQVYFGVYSSGVQTVNSSASFNDGRWHHVAAQQSSGGMKLFIDGNLVGSNAVTNDDITFSKYWIFGYTSMIGDWPSLPSNFHFGGTIDEVSIWNVALSESQIQSYMHGPPIGMESGVLYSWHFDEGTGVTTRDASGNGNNGTLVNGPTWVPASIPATSAPKNLTAVAGNETVSLKWNKNSEMDFLRYGVYGGTSPHPSAKIDSTTGGVTDTSKVIAGLTNGTTYSFRITAIDSKGNESAYSNEVNATPRARKHGDANNSGSVAPDDATAILRMCVGLDDEPALGTDAFYGADANNSGNISPVDASWVLYYVINDEYPNHSLPKASASSAIAFGKASVSAVEDKGQVIDVPLMLTNSGSVISAYVDLNIDNSVADVKYVNASLPEGSSMLYNYKNSALRIAIAGIHELANGTMVTIGISLKNKEAKLDISGFAQLNDNENITLGNTSIREIPTSYSLQNNYPNPFNPTTTLKYQIPENTHVRFVVYNMLGQVVRTLVDQPQEAGYYSVQWDGKNDYGVSVTSGIYVYRISAVRDGQAGSFVAAKKMNLIK
jgi:hypothetical protein